MNEGYPNPETWMTDQEREAATKEAEASRQAAQEAEDQVQAPWLKLEKVLDEATVVSEPLVVEPAENSQPVQSVESSAPLGESEVVETPQPDEHNEAVVEETAEAITPPEDGIDKEALAVAEREQLLNRALEIAIENCNSLTELWKVIADQIYYSKSPDQSLPQIDDSGAYPDPELMMLTNADIKSWLESKYPKLVEDKKWIAYLKLEGTDPWKDGGIAAEQVTKLRAQNQDVTAEALFSQIGIREGEMPSSLYNKFQELVSVELQNHLEKVSRYVQTELASALRSLNNSDEYQIFTDEKGDRGFKGALPRALNEYNRLKENPWVDGKELEQAWSGIFKLRDSLSGIRVYIQSHKEEIWTKYLKAVDDARPLNFNAPDGEYAAYREKYQQAAGEILKDSGVHFPDQAGYQEEYKALMNIVTSSGGNWLAKDIVDLRRQGIKRVAFEGDPSQERIEIDWDQVQHEVRNNVSHGYQLDISKERPKLAPSKGVTIAVKHSQYSDYNAAEYALAGFGENSALREIFGDQATLTEFMLQLSLDEAEILVKSQSENFVVDADAAKKVSTISNKSSRFAVSLGNRFMEGVDQTRVFGSYDGPYNSFSEPTRNEILLHAAGYLIGVARQPGEKNLQKILERFNLRLSQFKEKVTQDEVLAFAGKQYPRVPGVNEGETLAQALGIAQAAA